MSNIVNATIVSDPNSFIGTSMLVAEGFPLTQEELVEPLDLQPIGASEMDTMMRARAARNQSIDAMRLQARAEQRHRMQARPFQERVLAAVIGPRTRIHPSQEPSSSSAPSPD